jgi:hypothetical protein
MVNLGCYPASQKDILGSYVVRGATWGSAVLELREDGTFVEEATRMDGRKVRLEGRWEAVGDRISRRPCLLMTRFEIKEPNPDTGCSTSYYGYGLSHIALDIEPDAGVAYRKQMGKSGKFVNSGNSGTDPKYIFHNQES